MRRRRQVALLFLALAFSVSACLGQTSVHPQSIFDFHSGFWVNLHQFLYVQARADAESSDSGPWRAAVDYYKKQMIQHDHLSAEMATVNNALSDMESTTSLKASGLDPALIAVLEAAAPVYRERWWPEHDRGNHAWITSAQDLVEKYGTDLTKELAKVYKAAWPDQPIRTDVAVYASWAGAYTTLGPTHITVSSVDPSNSGTAALEILFHEASHALVRRVREALSRQAESGARELRRPNLWHAVLFYTAGTLVERHVENYSMYAIKNGLFDRAWPGALEVLDQDWKPYLDGKTDMDSAVRRLATDYSTPK
jgi:hypothetical protein